jgi:D-alanyl-D-alanine carboxypeptidase/D-alanyl-D-alanine-endopeptidase (penicillin-binding protein 4)
MRSRSPRTGRWVAGGLVVLAVAGYGTADALDVVPGVLTTSPPPAAATARPAPRDPAPQPADPVLPVLSDQAPAPSSAGLGRLIGPLLDAPALGPHVSAAVVDARSGELLLGRDVDRGHVPASTTKLLTAAAALTTVGGDTRLATRVVQGATPDEIVLVGGGDVLLGTGASQEEQVVGHAGLATLAAQVASALSSQGRREVAVRFDDSLFEGAAVSPAWDPSDLSHGYVGRVTALGLARDRPRTGHPGAADPSKATALAFVQALGRQGVTVTGSVARSRATADAPVLGEVRSASVASITELALTDSDNLLAEVLARLTARAMQRPTTFEDSALAVLDAVRGLDIEVGSAHIVDGSGLGHGSSVPARVLADLLVLASGDKEPRLRPMLAGLPVAGFSGTLTHRFTGVSTHRAAGLVRAKTGTLTGVSALAGLTVDADGRLLVLVLMADDVPPTGTLAARDAFDKAAVALTACGCR